MGCRQENIALQYFVIKRIIRLIAANNVKTDGMQELPEWGDYGPFAGRIRDWCGF